MKFVWMHNPDLPDQPIHVPETAVPQWRQSNWRTFSDDNKPDPEPLLADENVLTQQDYDHVPDSVIAKMRQEQQYPANSDQPGKAGATEASEDDSLARSDTTE